MPLTGPYNPRTSTLFFSSFSLATHQSVCGLVVYFKRAALDFGTPHPIYHNYVVCVDYKSRC